ncbi:MAG: leucine-rich repeat domain-containing protein [Anaeroplasma bactoclasticum]|nr:leucine-rich repeat domain-containing protein [Anaeroplasma bactoclasticum]
MHKKVKKFLGITILLLGFICILTSCGNTDSSKEKCEHNYSKYVGNKEGHYGVCDFCQQHSEVVPHNFGDWEITKEPTYTTPGSKARQCKECEYVEEDSVLEKACDHGSYTSWKVTIRPSLTSVGNLQRQCETCLKIFDFELPKLNETDYKFQEDKSDCISGTRQVYTYEKDGEKFDFEEYLQAEGHSYTVEWEWNENMATATFTCEKCNDVQTRIEYAYVTGDSTICTEKMLEVTIEFENKIYTETKPFEHSFQEEWETDGINHWHQCSLCGMKNNDVKPHEYEDGKCKICKTEYYTDGLEFTIDYFSENNDYEVSLKDGYNPESIVIPQKYKNKDVIAIKGYAFYNCTNLKNITLPNTIKNIGEGAFSGCINLTSINLPNTLESIWDNAFYNCTSLTEITIPSGVKYIGGGTFEKSGLKTISLHKEIQEIRGDAFKNCINLTEVIIGTKGNILETCNLEWIGRDAFYNCSSLKNIYLPKSIEKIESSAFKGCHLDNVYFKSNNANDWLGITFSDLEANPIYMADHFQTWQTSISGFGEPEEIHLSSSNIKVNIKDYAFAGLKNVDRIYIDNANVGRYAFYNAKGEIFFGKISSIGDYAFAKTEIHRVDLDSMEIYTPIGNYAFMECLNLETATATDSAITLPANIFDGCSKLKTVTMSMRLLTDLSDSFASGIEYLHLKQFAFREEGYSARYTSLKTIYWQGLYMIQSNIYNYFSNAQEFVFMGTIEDWCRVDISDASYNPIHNFPSFKVLNEDGLPEELSKNVVIPEGTIKIGEHTFDGVDIKSIVLPSTLKTIGNCAFQNCTNLFEIYNLSSLSIEKGSTANGYVGYYALAIANTLESLRENNDGFIFLKNETTTEYYLLGYEGTEKDLVLPNRAESDSHAYGYSIVANAFEGLDITSVVVLNKGIKIGKGAFRGCDNLESITLQFVGESLTGTTNTHFGYIFGATNYSENKTFVATSLTEVIITGAVRKIDNYAFYGCENLTSVTIGKDDITRIGNGAFYGCNGLTSITIPFVGESLTGTTNTHFGYIFGAFSYSDNSSYVPSSLKEVVILGGESIKESAFYRCSNLTSVEIPNSVESIGANAFYSCSNLTSIVIPNSVTSIGSSAFGNCSSLENVYYEGTIDDWCNISFVNYSSNPMSYASHFYMRNSNDEWEEVTSIEISNGVTEIGEYHFNKFTNVTSIVIPNSVTSIREGAFYGCSSLTSITIPFVGESLTKTNNTHFGYIFGASTYSGNSSYVPSSLKEVVILGGEIIEEDAFYGCSSLTSITIPNSVKSIGASAFSACYKLIEIYNLSSLNIVKGSTGNGYVGYYAKVIHTAIEESNLIEKDNYIYFKDAENKYYLVEYKGTDTELVLPNDIEGNTYEINQYAFENCSYLTSITIPESVTSIGSSAFENCSYLTSITIPESVTSIGSSAFAFCSNLKSIIIPSSVTSIEALTFYGCLRLESVTIPNSVTIIKEHAFNNCNSLESITIPNSVTFIEPFAFSNCQTLKEVYYKGTSSEWSNMPIGTGNSRLIDATLYYYSNTQPTEEGNYWHYVDDVITMW